jgi:hypothetical protein
MPVNQDIVDMATDPAFTYRVTVTRTMFKDGLSKEVGTLYEGADGDAARDIFNAFRDWRGDARVRLETLRNGKWTGERVAWFDPWVGR